MTAKKPARSRADYRFQGANLDWTFGSEDAKGRPPKWWQFRSDARCGIRRACAIEGQAFRACLRFHMKRYSGAGHRIRTYKKISKCLRKFFRNVPILIRSSKIYR